MKAEPKPQLIYLAFGAETYRTEAVFSIATALKHSATSAPGRAFDIQVFTDDPAPFSRLPVTTKSIAPAWRGPHDYHFRIKHVVLREVLAEHEKALLIDTDTFFKSSPDNLFQRIRPNSLLCNAFGSPLKNFSRPELLAAAKAISPVNDQSRQLNSGVIGLTRGSATVLERSIALMDDLYPAFSDIYTLEELCLAMAASRDLKHEECTDVIHHYWSRKDLFRAKINAWHRKHKDSPLGAEALADIGKVNDRLPKPGQPLRSAQKLLTLLIPREQRQFAREVLYGCYHYDNEFDQACSTVWWDKAVQIPERHPGLKQEQAEIEHWLAHPLLKRLAGRHYPQAVAHLTRGQ